MAASASAVSRVLTAGGMAKARWSASSRVKGWGNWIEGMQVENVTTLEFEEYEGWRGRGANRNWGPKMKSVKVPTGEVTVKYIAGSRSTGDVSEKQVAALAEAERLLVAKGYKVERKTDRVAYDRPYLSVTKED